MQILLKKDVEKLGEVGDVVTVKNGYARNYLFPHNIAVPVTPENMRLLEGEKKKKEIEKKALHQSMRELAEKLNNTSITITAKTEDDKLYGSVGPAEIVAALSDEGFTVDKRHVRMDEHIKQVGDFKVNIHLYEDVEATLRVWVVSE